MKNKKTEPKRLISRRDLLKSVAGSLPAIWAAHAAAAAQLNLPDAFLIKSSGANLKNDFRQAMRAIPDAQKFTVTSEKTGAPDKKGWYHHAVGVVDTPEGLVCVYRKSDSHTATMTYINVTRSLDHGRTWSKPVTISASDVWNTGGCWVAPQVSKLTDGRLVIIADFGNRNAGQDWPLLSQWQKPNRGMSNHLFWSSDHGKTWTKPLRIDEIGGEPGYIVELADGTLIFTRTEASDTDQIWNPPKPWGGNYYHNTAVFSDDQGKTWTRTAPISDDPLEGDCEVGIVELAPRNLLAVTRIGLGSGQFGQPSRFIYSSDNGQTWDDKRLSPIYAQRPVVRKLQSGNLLVTYRHSWGTPGTYACVFLPEERLPYQPTSLIWDETRTKIENGAMIIETGDGREAGAVFAAYPAQAPDSRIEINAELQVETADKNGCAISAGCFVRFTPTRIELADRPEEGFPIDATDFHRYRLIRENGRIKIFVDGKLKLDQPTGNLETRLVHFGNRLISGWFGSTEAAGGLGNEPPRPRPEFKNAGFTRWRSLSIKVDNKKDHSIDWKWTPADGFPDQFRRSRIVRLDRNGSFAPGNSGYSGWTQMKDGTIVICDYTCGDPPAERTFVRAYVTTEKDLIG